MKKEASDAARDSYKNKSVLNQRGGSLEFNNSTGQEGVYITNYHGSNIKITPQVTSEFAKENKQTLVVNDCFETIRNDKHLTINGNYIKNITGSTVYKSGFNNDEQVAAVEEWKEAYKPIALRNSMFDVKRGGKSYPNGVYTPEQGTKTANPSKSQEVYLNVGGEAPPGNSISEVRAGSDEVAGYANLPSGSQGTFTVKNPKTEDYIFPENLATEGGKYEYTPEKQTLKQDIENLQKQKLTDIEKRAFGDGPNVGGDEQHFAFRNKVEMVGAAVNDYPSIRFDDKGRSTPGRVLVGKNAGAYVDIESVPHVEEVNNSNFPVGNYSVHATNKYNINVGSGGVDIKTTGPVEIGATTYKLGAHKVNINASKGVHIGSENFVELTSLKNISLRSNKQIYIEPGLGVKNNLVVGGGTYMQGETYLHHVTAPAELQQTQETKTFGKLVDNLKFKADIDLGWPFGTKRNCKITIKSSDDDIIEIEPHSHHFLNLPLRLTQTGDNVKEMANEEYINEDGFTVPALPINHELKQPTATPNAPRPLQKEAADTLLPNDRERVEFNGTIKPEFEQVKKDGSFKFEEPEVNIGDPVVYMP
tara:strand:- start:704 stop:2470 length:1767 start_codon:yes stop_codon:yes gene_type:complete